MSLGSLPQPHPLGRERAGASPGATAAGGLLAHGGENLRIHAPDSGPQRGDQRVQPHQRRLCAHSQRSWCLCHTANVRVTPVEEIISSTCALVRASRPHATTLSAHSPPPPLFPLRNPGLDAQLAGQRAAVGQRERHNRLQHPGFW